MKGFIVDFKTLVTSLFGFTAPTFYSWKKEKRPIILLLEKYFKNEELIEFLETKEIEKLELINRYDINELRQLLNNIQPLKDGVLYSLFERFEFSSLVYLLYIFEKNTIVYNWDSLNNFIYLNPSVLINTKVTKFYKSRKSMFTEKNNALLHLDIEKLKRDCVRYLDTDDISYIFKHKGKYGEVILEIMTEKYTKDIRGNK